MKQKSRLWCVSTKNGRREYYSIRFSSIPAFNIGGVYSMDLSALLGHGRENAVSSDVLAVQLQTSARGLRDKILKARCNGEIILYAPGGHGGYFLPSDDPETAQKEMTAFYNVQAARCKHGLLAIAPVARRLGIPLGQQSFDSMREGK
ncbi:MAG: hypothetical protein PUI75_09090 [Subdoligranulum sp.]|nr:hypothetical protein [Subdoligranulum sp.]MDY6125549.1 hypothetical protein [Gemmiger qucibialis]